MIVKVIPFKRHHYASLSDDISDYEEYPNKRLFLESDSEDFDDLIQDDYYTKPSPYQFSINVSDYNPDDITVEIQDEKLHIRGESYEENEQGYDKKEFSRTLELPKNILLDTMKHWVSKRGNLVVEFERVVPEKRHPFEDLSTEESYKLKFDVKDYQSEQVNVNLNDSKLIIEAKSTDPDGNVDKHFKKVITLPSYVNKTTLKPTIKSDGYLYLEASHVNLEENPNIRKLEIVSE